MFSLRVMHQYVPCIRACLAVSILLNAISLVVHAQELLRQRDPSELGLIIPDGTPIPGGGRHVLVLGDNDEMIVARVHFEVADRLIVMLPNGKGKEFLVDEGVHQIHGLSFVVGAHHPSGHVDVAFLKNRHKPADAVILRHRTA